MKTTQQFNSFEEFWPSYLEAHASRASQVCHLLGLVASVATALFFLSIGLIMFLPLAIASAHLGASLGHRLSLRTATQAVEAHAPLWGAVADVKMCGLLVSGRLQRRSF